MRAKKRKIILPRKQWQINPVTRVKQSAKLYSRRRARRQEQISRDEE
jgi:hypothetical protein